MSLKIELYNDNLKGRYEELLEASPVSMFNHSIKFKMFLEAVLAKSTSRYLCAFENEKLVAALPLFLKSGDYGTVINSLPFFGSHGGMVYLESLYRESSMHLVQSLNEMIIEENAFSCTVIESPFDTQTQFYDSFAANFFDCRIGQVTHLPELFSDKVDLEEKLLSSYHQKTRNMVRKGIRSNFSVSHDGSLETKRALYSIHKENIESIGGAAKSWEVFEAIHLIFEYDVDYRVYTARKDGKIVSALLVFYFKDMVEYFTPATLAEYRSDQPLSLLIFRAMYDSVKERQMRLWNWGGTWLTQSGVYQFKARWGTRDVPYRYHVKTSDTFFHSSNVDKHALVVNYSSFYTIPFNRLTRE